jgi:cell division septum initiation protein DivIVA
MSLPPVLRRLADALWGAERQEPQPIGSQLAGWLRDERGQVGADVLPRFALSRHGYDCPSVDEYVAQLEAELAALDQELVELRARTGPGGQVENEIKRIGEQTSTVLIAAHEQREEILRLARAEAERCVADARAEASAVAAQGEERLRELEAQTEAVGRERERLLEDVRTVSAALAAVAESAHDRVPTSSEQAVA